VIVILILMRPLKVGIQSTPQHHLDLRVIQSQHAVIDMDWSTFARASRYKSKKNSTLTKPRIGIFIRGIAQPGPRSTP
jgi:sigma54-dependent transcription regulator